MKSTDPERRSLRDRGRIARRRAQERAGSGRITASAWWPEVEWLRNLGYTHDDIAWALSLTSRRIRQIVETAETGGVVVVRPEARPRDQLEPEYQRMLDFSSDGFKRFFDEFSGHTLPAHAEDWVGQFCEYRNLMLNVPPGHIKTTVFSVWLPMWLLARDRDEQILLISMTWPFARDNANEIAYNLEFNDHLIEVFGRFAPEKQNEKQPWRPSQGQLLVAGRSRVATSGQMSVESRGRGQQILGKRATVVVVDDMTDASVSKSETQRLDEIQWLREKVFTRIMPLEEDSGSGRAVIVGQRVHYKDVYGTLEKDVYVRDPVKKGQKLWTVIKRPAVIRWPDEDRDHPEPIVLWPELFSYDELMVQYERLGSTIFETMYQQNPLPEDARLVDQAWWDGCRDYDRPGYRGAKDDPAFLPVARVLSIDPGVKRFHGLSVWDVPYIPMSEAYYGQLVEAKHWQGPQKSIVEELERCVRDYRLDYIIMEKVSFTEWLEGDPVYQELKKKVRIIPHTTGKNKGDPERGIESMSREIEMGRIRLPYGDDKGKRMSQLFEDEANVWPFGDHDDVLMTGWFVKWNWRRLIPQGALETRIHMPSRADNPPGYYKAALKKREQAARAARLRRHTGE